MQGIGIFQNTKCDQKVQLLLPPPQDEIQAEESPFWHSGRDPVCVHRRYAKKQDFQRAFPAWQEWWEQCITAQGHYFEGDGGDILKSGTYCFIFTDAVACRTHMYKITMWSASYIQIYQLGVPEPEQSQELPARSHCKVGIIFLCNVREEKARNFMCEFDSVHTSLSEMPMYMYSVSM